MKPMTSFYALVCAAITVGTTGCGGSSWQDNYQGERASSIPAGQAVTVREVPARRVADFLAKAQREAASSDQHPDDWPEEKRAAFATSFYQALQLPFKPEESRFLGETQFVQTEDARQHSDDPYEKLAGGTYSMARGEDTSLERLEQHARAVGANFVVYTHAEIDPQTALVLKRSAQEAGYSQGTARVRDLDTGREADVRYRADTTVTTMQQQPVKLSRAAFHAWYFVR